MEQSLEENKESLTPYDLFSSHWKHKWLKALKSYWTQRLGHLIVEDMTW
jgi:hypothetical protein